MKSILKKSGKPVLFLFISFISVKAIAEIPNCSGRWDGKADMYGIEYNADIYLKNFAPGKYSGVLFLQSKPFQGVGAKRPYTKISFVLQEEDNELTFNRITVLENYYLKISAITGTLKFSQEKDKLALRGIISSDERYSLSYSFTKKKDDIPKEYESLLPGTDKLKLENIIVKTEKNSGVIKYNSSNTIAFTVKNTMPFDFGRLKVNITSPELTDTSSKRFLGYRGYFDLAKNGQEDISLDLLPGFELPQKTMRLKLDISSEGFTVCDTTLSIQTEAFFKALPLTVSKGINPRLELTGYYYTLKKYNKNNLAKLDSLSAKGDMLAQMWRAIFYYMGYGGSNLDEVKGVSMASKAVEYTENKASNGDAEAAYLLFYAYQMNCRGEAAKRFAVSLLSQAAAADFLPAQYDLGLQYYAQGKYREASDIFQKTYAAGLYKSAAMLGFLAEKGKVEKKDVTKAIEYYNKGIANSDPDAMMKLANLYSSGNEVEPDINKAEALAQKAAALNFSPAMDFLGRMYLNGKNGKQKNAVEALKWFKASAALGDREGMTALALLYSDDGLPGINKDETSAFFWAKKAAESGEGSAMALVSRFYAEGMGTEASIIKARYWYNQGVKKGKGVRDDVDTRSEDLLNVWKYADFSPTYTKIYWDDGSEEIVSSGPDILGGILGGMISSYAESRARSQEVINGCEFIQEKGNSSVYGGTITSYDKTNISVKKGQLLGFIVDGKMTLGWMLSGITANGINDNMYATYSIVPAISHGAFIVRIGEGDWVKIGAAGILQADNDGELQVAINDRDYSNNQGYLDYELLVQD